MSEIELLPCPFCGGEASISEIPSAGGGTRVIQVAGCNNEECDVEFPGHARKVDAAKQWNTRVNPDLDRLTAENAALTARVEMLLWTLRIVRAKLTDITLECVSKGPISNLTNDAQDAIREALALGAGKESGDDDV